MEWQPPCSPQSHPDRQQAGAEAEQSARRHLEQHGCQFVCANYRSRRGEIDLIMTHQNRLLFVEVRMRRHEAFGGAAGSITYAKQQKVIACARAFLHHHPQFHNHDCRFDVVTLQRLQHSWQIDWLPDAFTT